MMQSYINKYFKNCFLLLGLFSLISCYKDLGNYDYNEKNSITISGIDSTYTILVGDTLKIKPQLSIGDKSDWSDTSRYTFSWKKEFFSSNGMGDGLVNLGNTKDIAIPINSQTFMVNQANSVYFVVIDKKLAARAQFVVTVNVITQSSFTRAGWYVLSEVNSGSRLSMISFTTTPAVLYKDVLATLGSALHLNEKGLPLSVTVDNNLNLGVTTEKEAFFIPILGGLEWKSQYTLLNKFVIAPPANTKIQFMRSMDVSTTNANTVFADNNYYVESATYSDAYSRPVNQYYTATKPFKASPYFGGFWTERGLLMFDMDRRGFSLFRLNLGASYAEPVNTIAIEGGATVTLPVNKDLRFMAKVRYFDRVGQVFAILKDPADKYSLLRFEPRIATRTPFVLKAPEEEIVATDFSKAENITINPLYGYIYYNVGSKIYAYDPIGTKTTKMMLDVAPEKISLIDFNASSYNTFFRSASASELTKLAVATYDPSLPEGSKGKLSFYTVPSSMGAITPVGTAYTGFGIIKSIVFVGAY